VEPNRKATPPVVNGKPSLAQDSLAVLARLMEEGAGCSDHQLAVLGLGLRRAILRLPSGLSCGNPNATSTATRSASRSGRPQRS